MILIQIIIVIFTITIHEYAHTYVALKFGDDTAYRLGRLSLNPLHHIDIIGTIVLPIFLYLFHLPVFGWAKPVFIDYRNFKNPPRDYMLVGLAGPAANLLLALVFAALNQLYFHPIYQAIIIINVFLAVINLFPVPPLDGSRFIAWLLPRRLWLKFIALDRYGIFFIIILLYIGFFRIVLIPIFNFVIRFFGVG